MSFFCGCMAFWVLWLNAVSYKYYESTPKMMDLLQNWNLDWCVGEWAWEVGSVFVVSAWCVGFGLYTLLLLMVLVSWYYVSCAIYQVWVSFGFGRWLGCLTAIIVQVRAMFSVIVTYIYLQIILKNAATDFQARFSWNLNVLYNN